jgi:NitT/TauT family transport system substrate-binding protein
MLLGVLIPGIASGGAGLVMRVGILPVIDTLPLIVAEEQGLFREEGITVKIINFNSALERDAAIRGNALDGYFGDLLNTIFLNAGGDDLRVITTAYHTRNDRRMFALLASPGSDITGVSQIRNVPIAVSTASIIEYFLDKITEKEGVPREAVKKIEIRQIPIRYQMLITDSVTLALLPEPLASKAIADGARLIADDRKLDMTATVIAMKADFLVRNPDLCTRFLKAYARSVAMINSDPPAFTELLVRKTRFPPSLAGAYTLHTFPKPGLPSTRDVMSVVEWLTGRKLIPDGITYGDTVWEGAGGE